MNRINSKLCILLIGCMLSLGEAAYAAYGTRSDTIIQDIESGNVKLDLSKNIVYTPGVGLKLAYDKGYATCGTATSKPVTLAFPCNGVLISWNFDLPLGTAVIIDARMLDGEKKATSWYELARVGTVPNLQNLTSRKPLFADKYGSSNVDVIMTKDKWKQIQYRITLFSLIHHHSPTFRLMVFNIVDESTKIPYTPYTNESGKLEPWMKSLNVRWRSQSIEDRAIAGEICGPTSLAQAMEYDGINIPTPDVASECYDFRNAVFGNWGYLAQTAGMHGLRSYATRCQDFSLVEKEIAEGNPILLCIAFKPGELTGAPIKSTTGHFILCVGFTKDGDLICNDPGTRSNKWDHVIYKRSDIANVWLTLGGDAVVVERRDASTQKNSK